MSIFPNYQTSITANTGLERIQSLMPQVALANVKIDYSENHEILMLENLTSQDFTALCELLDASGIYNQQSNWQSFHNLGAYAEPVAEWNSPNTCPTARKSTTNDSFFVILDIHTKQIVDTRHMLRKSLDCPASQHTHFSRLTDAVNRLFVLKETMTPIDHLRIVELNSFNVAQ